MKKRSTKYIAALIIVTVFAVSIIGYVYYQSLDLPTPDRKIMTIKESPKTKVYGVLNVPIAKNNMIWCGTLQLAWNELRDNIIKEDIKLDGENKLSNELNKESFDKRYLDKKDYIAAAGYNKDGIVEKVNKLLKEKFDEDGEWKVSSKLNSPEDILSYSFLKKNLQFKHAFEDIKSKLNFKGVKVKAFGIYKTKDGEIRYKLSKQVNILYYNNDNNFIVSLKNKSSKDEIVLANIYPKDTLSETLNYALKLTKKTKDIEEIPFAVNDMLEVPMFGFDVSKHYEELENKDVENKKFMEYKLDSVMQKIVFSLTEKGAQLKSKAEIVGVKYCAARLNKPKKLIFNKPFLLYMKEKGNNKPYFAMWVDNSNIMLK